MLRLIALTLLAFVTAAHASTDVFPSKPIRIVVPYSPGGPSDVISRAFALELGKILKTTTIVENKPGAGTAIGSQSVKYSPADGYTLLFGANIFITTTLTMKTPGYQLEDFAPVVHLGDTFYVLAAPKLLNVSSFSEFLEQARKNAGQMNYATLGPGATSHLLADRLKRVAKFDWQDIAYRGTVPALQAIMTNEVQGYFISQGSAVSLKDSDKIALLAIASDERSSIAPWLPTFRELGFPEMTEPAWFALFARSDTPAPILEKLRLAAATAMTSPAVLQQQQNLGLSPNHGNLDQFARLLVQERSQRAAEFERIGLKPE